MASKKDPVAAQSGFLSTYMNRHPDTLYAYVLKYDKPKTACDCKMESIDSNGFVLTYCSSSKPDSKLERKSVHIPFTPPLKSYDVLKERLIQMKIDAEESVGMAKIPTITRAPKPTTFWHLLTGVLLAMLIICSLNFDPQLLTLKMDDQVKKIYIPATALRNAVGGWKPVTISWTAVVLFHIPEALLQLRWCTKHSTPFGLTLSWVLTTFTFGFPSLLQFKRYVHRERIESATRPSSD